ncbi:DUF5673 domain-containing protein [Clostridium sp.]|uniref:DUF5673 domain-containing protein n=1 Tax=Clostridium sp. TaxID=1506 RepID=UPI0028423441|nr:DUF5673 domain-containing protein [Clostridium sp.]MDR3596721.1 DUF5673 domain-containing protein [Clostridium sp.]
MSSIFILIFVSIIDIVLIVKDIKNKLIFSGRKKFKAVIPIMIIAFIGITLEGNNFRIEDIIVCIAILPLVFVGNKSGITEKGFLFNSYVTPWDKVESYSLSDQGEKYIVSYKTNLGARKIVFNQEYKNDVKKYLLGINKLRYSRK